MWVFKGTYSGEAKAYIKKKEKKEAVTLSLFFSILIIIIFAIMAIVLGDGNATYIIIILCIGLGTLGFANLVLFIYYRRDPKSVIEITNDGFNVYDMERSFSFAFYKIGTIEYYDDFIVVSNKYVLQKDLMVEGDWEDLKSLLKKVEESLDSDEPMYQIEEPSTEFFNATVKSKRIFKKFVGVQMVRSTFEYFAIFALENGEEVEYEIGQEWYEKIEKGQTGTLVLVNRNFFAFGDGEDV